MRTTLAVLVAAVAALAAAAAGESAAKGDACVGGPHCYATLQAALDAAADGDTIRIGPGTFAGGVTITKSVTLTGVDAHASKISGGGPVVTIGSTTSAPTVTLDNLTITGGLTTSNPHAPECGLDVPVCGPGYANSTAIGGGIETFAGTNVTISDSIVTGNRATPAHTTLSVKATCAGGPCPAAFGDAGGIDVWGSMTIVDSTISDNHASAPAQSNGGGIAVHSDASLSLSGSQVTGNSAAATGPTGRFVSGGGIFVNSDASLTLDDSSIDSNTSSLTTSLASPYPMQDGNTDFSNSIAGGLFLADGSTATIRHSTLNGNTASVDSPFNQSFGADAALCACGEVALTIDDSRIEGNNLTVDALASDFGPNGPATLESDADGAQITNTRIDGNTGTVTTSGDTGGLIGAVALFPSGDAGTTLTGSSISRNTMTADAPNGDAEIAGAGLFNNGPLTVESSTISGNRGVANGPTGFATGGGIVNGFFGGPAPLTLRDSRVTGNTLAGSHGVTLSGGGIYTVGFPTTLTNTVVAHNSPDDCEGC
jgi:Right handed beta helix region